MHRILFILFALLLAVAAPACSKKAGCEATESLKPKMNKKGEFKKGKASQGLFPKKMAKKMKK